MVTGECANSILLTWCLFSQECLPCCHGAFLSLSFLLLSPHACYFLLVITLHIWQMTHKVDSLSIQLPSVPSIPSTYRKTVRSPARELPAPVMARRKETPTHPNHARNLPVHSPDIDPPQSASSRHFRPVFKCWQHIQHYVHAFNPEGSCVTDDLYTMLGRPSPGSARDEWQTQVILSQWPFWRWCCS